MLSFGKNRCIAVLINFYVIMVLPQLWAYGDNLNKEYYEFIKTKGNSQLEIPSVRKSWINKYENKLSGGTSTFEDFYDLAGLYRKDEKYKESIILLNSVMDDKKAYPSLRLNAGLLAIHSSVSANESLDKTFHQYTLFENSIKLLKKSNIPYSHFYDCQAFSMDHGKAAAIQTYGYKLASKLRSQGNNVEANIIWQQHSEMATQVLEKYLTKIEEYPQESQKYSEYLKSMNVGKTSTLFKLGKLYYEQGNSLAENQPLLASTKYSLAVKRLEKFFNEDPQNSLSDSAGRILLDLEYFHCPSTDIVSNATDLFKKIAPGHGSISTLLGIGMDMTNKSKLLEANKVYDLIISIEKEWFPEKFKEYTNYQYALLYKGKNLLELVDMSGACEIINTLKSLSLKGEDIKAEYNNLSKRYNEYFENVLKDTSPELTKKGKNVTSLSSSKRNISKYKNKKFQKEDSSKEIALSSKPSQKVVKEKKNIWFLGLSVFGCIPLLGVVYCISRKKQIKP